MFGFGKKKAPSQLQARLLQLADDATAAIGGAYDEATNQLLFRGFSINIGNVAERRKLIEEFRDLWTRLSRNPDDWKSDMQLIQDQVRAAPAQSDHMLAAFQFLAAILKMNLLCKAALEYPDDVQLKKVVAATIGLNAVVIDKAFAEEDESLKEADASYDRFPSIELFGEVIYIRRFLNEVTGMDHF